MNPYKTKAERAIEIAEKHQCVAYDLGDAIANYKDGHYEDAFLEALRIISCDVGKAHNDYVEAMLGTPALERIVSLEEQQYNILEEFDVPVQLRDAFVGYALERGHGDDEVLSYLRSIVVDFMPSINKLIESVKTGKRF